jgi:hypothetical protein
MQVGYQRAYTVQKPHGKEGEPAPPPALGEQVAFPGAEEMGSESDIEEVADEDKVKAYK